MELKKITGYLSKTFRLPFNSLCPIAVAWDTKFDLGLQEHIHGSQGWKDNAFGMKIAHTLKKWKQGRCRENSCMKSAYILKKWEQGRCGDISYVKVTYILKKWGIKQKKRDSLFMTRYYIVKRNVKIRKSSKVGVLFNTVHVCSVAL